MAKPKVDKGAPISKEDCIAIGEKALASFSRSELQGYADEVFAKAESYQDVKGQAAIQRALDEINNQQVRDLFGECKTIANNAAKFDVLKSTVEQLGNLRETLTPRGKSQANNVSSAQAAAKGKLFDTVFKDMTAEQQEYLMKKENMMDVASALDGDHASTMAKDIAKIIEKFTSERDAEMLRSDAISIGEMGLYKYLDHVHDPSLLINGGSNFMKRAMDLVTGNKTNIGDPRKRWIDYIKPKLDLDTMFPGKRIEKADKILGDMYDNITTNRDQPFVQSTVINDRERIRNRKRMRILFKDWKSFGEYNGEYGHGDLMSSLFADIQGSGNRIGMADIYGDSPLGTYLDLKEVQRDIGFAGINKISPNTWFSNTDLIWTHLTGANQKAVSPGMATFFSNIRSITSMTRLLRLALLSAPDVSHGTAYLGRFQFDQMKSLGYFLTNMFDNKMGNLAFPERQAIAKKFGLLANSHIGYLARATDASNSGKFVNKLVSNVFKFVRVDAMDKGNKVSVMHLMASGLGDASKTKWSDLHLELKKQLQNHNVTEHEWELLRGKTKKGLFTTDNVDAITDAELRDLKSDVPMLNRRADLYRKVYSFFDVASQNVTLNPDAFSKAFIYGGTTPGTAFGELTRMFMQFKMYPVNYMDRVWNQGLRNADGMMPKLAFAARLMAMTAPLSYLSMWADYASMGKSMPDPSEMTLAQQERFFISLALPGTGVFLGLMDPRNQNNGLLMSTIKSPSMSFINDSLSSLLALIGGDTEKSMKELKRAAKALVPIDTTPLISPLLREAMGDTPYLQPGQEQNWGA